VHETCSILLSNSRFRRSDFCCKDRQHISPGKSFRPCLETLNLDYKRNKPTKWVVYSFTLLDRHRRKNLPQHGVSRSGPSLALRKKHRVFPYLPLVASPSAPPPDARAHDVALDLRDEPTLPRDRAATSPSCCSARAPSAHGDLLPYRSRRPSPLTTVA
jgi:hypothetical protein